MSPSSATLPEAPTVDSWKRARALVRQAFALTRELGLATVLLRTDSRRSARLVARERGTERVIWIVTTTEIAEPFVERRDGLVVIPEMGPNVTDQIRAGLFSALIRRHVSPQETVLRLSGIRAIDSLSIIDAQQEVPWPSTLTRHPIPSHVLDMIVRLALRLAVEGREGQPVGTSFVVGRVDELAPYLRQLILNPCKGHPRKLRSLRKPEFFETLRELSALDGAFVVNTRGIVESAGTYLDVPPNRRRLRPGFGARHRAAASITATANCVAVVLSESGAVRIFHGGRLALEFESPRRV